MLLTRLQQRWRKLFQTKVHHITTHVHICSALLFDAYSFDFAVGAPSRKNSRMFAFLVCSQTVLFCFAFAASGVR